MSDIHDLTSLIDQFSRKQGWTRFHDQKNLVMALSVEVSELVEHFQWEDPAAFDSFSTDRREQIAMEAADVAIYLLRFCSVSNIDLPDSILKKLQKNSERLETPDKQ